jgi:GxxExxY protein
MTLAKTPATRVKTDLDRITYKAIGCAMAVHNSLGPGLKESNYHHALHLEMSNAGLTCEEEVPVEVEHDGARVGMFYLDHLVEGCVVVEDKAFTHQLTNEELAQLITYLAATGHPQGLLLNFGRQRLQYKRVFRPQRLDAWQNRIKRYVWNPSAPDSFIRSPIR